MPVNRFDGDVHVAGRLVANAFTAPDDSLGSAQFTTSDPLVVTKQRHLHLKNYTQPQEGSVYEDRQVIHVAINSGTVEDFRAGMVTPAIGDSTCRVDLYKNGVSILSDPSDLSSSETAYDQILAGIDPAAEAYVQGDVFEVVVTLVVDGTGTPGEGVFAQCTFDEGSI